MKARLLSLLAIVAFFLPMVPAQISGRQLPAMQLCFSTVCQATRCLESLRNGCRWLVSDVCKRPHYHRATAPSKQHSLFGVTWTVPFWATLSRGRRIGDTLRGLSPLQPQTPRHSPTRKSMWAHRDCLMPTTSACISAGNVWCRVGMRFRPAICTHGMSWLPFHCSRLQWRLSAGR